MRRRGFTLVELLVVIGIIALLISILLPSLQSARRSAQRVVCLSNMRQVHLSFVLYAHDNQDAAPLGCSGNTYQFNYSIWRTAGGSGKYQTFGLLWETETLTEPEILYCPSANSRFFQYDTEEANPFRPGEVGFTVRTGYSGRPTDPKGVGILWTSFSPPPSRTVNDANEPRKVPKLSQYKNKAIFADIISAPRYIDTRHEEGINVLYANGAARWVVREVIDEELEKCDPQFNPAYNSFQQNVWEMLDADMEGGEWEDEQE